MDRKTCCAPNVELSPQTSLGFSRRAFLGCGASAVALGALGGCAENAALGRSQLIFVSDAQLAQLSLASWGQLKQKTPISHDAKYNAQLQRVGPRIAQAAGLGGAGWEYVVFDSKDVNAFVLPGGKVGFYTGIMKLFDNDDQCAVVMGHETGHVVARHAAERYSESQAANLGVSIAAIAVGGNSGAQVADVLGTGVNLGVLLPFSRKHESEADKLGLDYCKRAGYDPRQAIPFWERMEAKGGSRPPEFLSTHPDPETRIARLKAQLRTMGYSV